jgi:thiamine kinase-like enzyme
LEKLILDNYNIEIKNMLIIDSHFGTEIFLIETKNGKYIVKTLPLYVGDLETEGKITDFLYDKGLNVARLVKTNNGMYHIKTDKMQFHVQKYIEGKTLMVNTAPEWFMKKSAFILGKIHSELKDYDKLKTNFGKDFFYKSTVLETIKYYNGLLNKAVNNKNTSLVSDIEERLKHLDRISSFNIYADKLTYTNSHGDFHIGQIITNKKELMVIDWTSASSLPVCLEVILSYVTEDPICVDGKIDVTGLKKYIDNYSKYFTLNKYDIQMMPYIFYYQQLMCHYEPPYNVIPDTYKPICNLINNFTKWLYENVETISNELCK